MDALVEVQGEGEGEEGEEDDGGGFRGRVEPDAAVDVVAAFDCHCGGSDVLVDVNVKADGG